MRLRQKHSSFYFFVWFLNLNFYQKTSLSWRLWTLVQAVLCRGGSLKIYKFDFDNVPLTIALLDISLDDNSVDCARKKDTQLKTFLQKNCQLITMMEEVKPKFWRNEKLNIGFVEKILLIFGILDFHDSDASTRIHHCFCQKFSSRRDVTHQALMEEFKVLIVKRYKFENLNIFVNNFGTLGL